MTPFIAKTVKLSETNELNKLNHDFKPNTNVLFSKQNIPFWTYTVICCTIILLFQCLKSKLSSAKIFKSSDFRQKAFGFQSMPLCSDFGFQTQIWCSKSEQVCLDVRISVN